MDVKLTESSCRVCFKKCTIVSTNASNLATLFHELVGYQIHPEDIPQKFCLECVESLFLIQKFKEKCYKAEQILEKLRVKVSSSSNFNNEKDENEEKLIVQMPEMIYVKEEQSESLLVDDDMTRDDDENDDFNNTPPQTPSDKTSQIGKRGHYVRNWAFSKMDDYLKENHISRTDIHKFILEYEQTRPDPEKLMPNLDVEVYEEQGEEIDAACTYCTFRGPRMELKKHCVKNAETHKNMFRCTCGHCFFSLDLLRSHSALPRVVHGKKRILLRKLRCDFCMFSCCHERTMEVHCKKMHKKFLSEQEICAECGITFFCDDLKLQHIVFRCNNGDNSVQIPFSMIFGKEIGSCRPIGRDRSTKYNKIMCELCGKDVSKDKIRKHIESYHENRRFLCDFDNKSYTNKQDLTRHMQRYHMQEPKSFPCQFCDRIFNIWSTRYYHIKANHNTEPYPHVCQICSKRFSNTYHLSNHMATHSKTLDHPCDLCDGVFKSKKHLTAHKRHVHSTRTYSCKTCGKTFKSAPLLKQHSHSHEPNKYFCPVCAQSFSVAHSLRGHVEQKHPEYEMPPPGTVLRHADINELKKNNYENARRFCDFNK